MFVPLVFILMVGAAISQETSVKPTHPPATLDRVLGKRPQYSMFLDLLKSSGLINQLDALQNLTLFAPTNQALASIPVDDFHALETDSRRLMEVLQYHASDGKVWRPSNHGKGNDRVLPSLDHDLPIRINVYNDLHTVSAEGINVTEKNIRVANGMVFGIDGLMQPPKGDIVEIINMNPDLSTLASLIAASGLDATIRADHNITVFAPTNAALANLNPAVLSYLKHTPSALQEVLEYHIVPQTSLYSIGMRHQMLFNTAAGKRRDHDQLMLLENNDGGQQKIFVNNAQVTKPDVSATNGVLHEVDDLLIPTGILIKMEDMGLGHHMG